jgi:hypothetical protein
VLGSLTRLPVAVGFPTLAKQVAAIILKPSLAVTISRSSVGLRPCSFRAFFEAVQAVHLLYLPKTPNRPIGRWRRLLVFAT